MAGSSASPISTRKRPKYSMAKLKLDLYLHNLESLIGNLNNRLEVFEIFKDNQIVIANNWQVIKDLCWVIKQMIENCPDEQFRFMLDGRENFQEGSRPLTDLIYNCDHHRRIDEAVENVGWLKYNFNKCKETLNDLPHLQRYNNFQIRGKKRWRLE